MVELYGINELAEFETTANTQYENFTLSQCETQKNVLEEQIANFNVDIAILQREMEMYNENPKYSNAPFEYQRSVEYGELVKPRNMRLQLETLNKTLNNKAGAETFLQVLDTKILALNEDPVETESPVEDI